MRRAMNDYCSCRLERTDEPSLKGGIIVCPDCERPICCDALLVGSPEQPEHPAEIGNGTYFICWWHNSNVLMNRH